MRSFPFIALPIVFWLGTGCSEDPQSDPIFAPTGGTPTVGGTTGTGTAGLTTGGSSTTGAAATTGGVTAVGPTSSSGTTTTSATATSGSLATTGGVVVTSDAVTSTAAGGATGSTTGSPDSTSTTAAVTTGAVGTTGSNANLEPFSFFVTSLAAMRQLSGSQDGFGGDLRYGEADGLTGADKICTEIAEMSMPGSGAKQWRAFLSVENGPDGGQVNAIDRVGTGPWYDRNGRVVAMDLDGLLQERPAADPEIAEDLPNENGEPNHTAGGEEMDNHDILTGSDENGELDGSTCSDWTSTSGDGPEAGHSWPANSGQHWISSHGVAGCAPSVVMGQGSFGGNGDGGVGDGGGYGGIYCFALSP